MAEQNGAMENGAAAAETAAATEAETTTAAGSNTPISIEKTLEGTAAEESTTAAAYDNSLPDDYFNGSDDWEDAPMKPEIPEGMTEADILEPTEDDPLGLRRLIGQEEGKPPQSQNDKQTTAEPSAAKSETPPPAPEPETPKPDYEALWKSHLEQETKEKFRDVYKAQINHGMTPEAAKMIASNAVGGKEYSLEDAPEDETTEKEGAASPAPAAFAEDLKALTRLYPDMAKPGEGIPMEVMREYQSGTPLLTAYAAHRSKKDAATIAALRAEIATLKQNALNRDTAVVRGVGGNTTATEADDPFLQGLDAEW